MKVQVIMSDDVVFRIDRQAAALGLSRSSYCAAAIMKNLLKDESEEERLKLVNPDYMGQVFNE